MALVVALAWRNLWRNTRRTLLSAGAIAVMVVLLIFALSMQFGGYDAMVDHATGPSYGHIQIQHPEYIDSPRVRHLLQDAEAVAETIRTRPDIRGVATRAQSSALASAGEKTFGTLVVGVEAEHEPGVSWLPGTVSEGRYLSGATGEAVIGRLLANNLGIALGDELVLLGVTPDDAMAVVVAQVVGLLNSGTAAVDRSMVHIPLGLFQEAFEIDAAAHSVAVMFERYTDADDHLTALSHELGSTAGNASVADWRRLMPEIESAIASDKVSSLVMYSLLVILVTFSIANTFVMMIFERTREFGTLLAMGARPATLIGTIQLETLFLTLIGTAIGAILGVLAAYWVGQIGISLGSESQQLLAQFQMPERIFFGVSWPAVMGAPLIMVVTTQLAAYFASRRVRSMQIVEAIGEEL